MYMNNCRERGAERETDRQTERERGVESEIVFDLVYTFVLFKPTVFDTPHVYRVAMKETSNKTFPKTIKMILGFSGTVQE